MANLKEIRVRIASVKSTRQITSAMKMVSASKLRKAQNSVINLRPYTVRLRGLLNILQRRIEGSGKAEIISPFAVVRPVKNVLITVFTANKGLCGPYNSFVIKKTLNHIAEFDSDVNVKLFIIGKKGYEFFKKREWEIVDCELNVMNFDNYQDCMLLAERLMQMFISEDFDKIELIYNQFKNPAVQEVICEQFLPLYNKDIDPDSYVNQMSLDDINDVILEPDEDEVINELIPKTIKAIFYRTLLDSFASEQGARMTAMHKATDNASEVLRELNIKYNKARQAAITGEIVEIVSGAEALNQ